MDTDLLWTIAFYGVLIPAFWTSFRYFRDLGDITQKLMTVTRENMVFAIRHEYKLIFTGLLGVAAAGLIHAQTGVGPYWVAKWSAILVVGMLSFPYIWLHYGLRNQQTTAQYYDFKHARNFVRPDNSVIVLDNNGEARAHPDYHIKRPHLAGSPEGLGGENIIMTYCCMTHLGLGFKPEIDGEKLDLAVLAQIGNNLIMRDQTGEPIQQMYGTREDDGRWSEHAMQPWPTYRMTFRGFQKAFPDGKVFLNHIKPITSNPFLYFLDHLVEAIFVWGTIPHHTNESLMFETMDVKDDRLMLKDLVHGFNVGKDSCAYTEEFIRENGNIVNATVGGRDIVAAWDPDYESAGIYYNDTGAPVTSVDFWGKTDTGATLTRVENVKAQTYWCVWVNYYPETDVNRVGGHNLSRARLTRHLNLR